MSQSKTASSVNQLLNGKDVDTNPLTKSGKRKPNGTLLGLGGIGAIRLELGENGDKKGAGVIQQINMKGRPTSSTVNPTTVVPTSSTKPSTQSAHPPSLISVPKIESNVIKIIQREWDKEVERLDAKRVCFKGKQQPGDKSLVQSGHAEIESNKILYIFGNALEVLQRSEFYD